MQIDLVDLELLIRALGQERDSLHAPAVDEEDRAFYHTLDRGDLTDRLTRLMKFFREQKKRHTHRGGDVKLELRVDRSET